MKLTRQIRLFFQEGSSDKVYEIDLCEVGPDRYVVNYRFGRRGARLKEGSQTTAPVAHAEAQRVFDTLAASKIKKGYREISEGSAPPAAPPAAGPAPARSKAAAEADKAHYRGLAVMRRLQAGASSGAGWPLERAIWRAGELRLRAAAPHLIRLIGSASSKPLRDYCIAWALGRLGDGSAVEPLVRLWRGPGSPAAVRRIAVEALRQLSDPDTRAEMARDLTSELPPEIRKPAQSGSPDATEALLAALRKYLSADVATPAPPPKRAAARDEDDEDEDEDDDDEILEASGGDAERSDVLETLYLIDSDHVRPALLEFLRTAPLRPNYFHRLRHIFKAAEYRRDGEVFGLLAYRFEKERAYFRPAYYGSRYVSLVGGRTFTLPRKDLRAELGHAEAKIAFGTRTRQYLRRRVWRTLFRIGELSDLDYVKMAVGVLLPYSDADAVPTKKRGKNGWDSFAPYWAYNHILHGKSPRYRPSANAKTWHCKKPYKPGDPEPSVREESFQKLWNERPQGLLHLLAESRAKPVHHFAVKALRANASFVSELDVETVTMLIASAYEVTAQLGCELAEKFYSATSPNHALVLAMAGCVSEAGRARALRWIDENRTHFLGDGDLVLALCLSRYADTRAFARKLLSSSEHLLAGSTATALIVRMIAHLMSLGAADGEQARDIAGILTSSLGSPLRRIGYSVMLDLLRHPLREVQELGGALLLNHETKPADLPAAELDALLGALLSSAFESVRSQGMRLLGQVPERTLRLQQELWRTLCMHAHADLRNAARPLLARLIAGHPDFAARMATILVEGLHQPEATEGVHAHLLRLLREDLKDGTARLLREDALRLCAAKSSLGQELGGQLLLAHPDWADHIATTDIVRLGSAEVKAVREASWALFTYAMPRFHADTKELADAVRLLEAKWDDSREFAEKTIRESFTERDFTPEVLIGICDSVRPDVQAFGRELVTRFFADEHGQEYLLKLSEHPTADLQAFATNYLERYAAGNIARLRALTYYFVSVLSRVNQGRLAKNRVYTFLVSEAKKSEEAARLASEVLERVSATIAIGDRARALEAMLEIRKAYPAVTLPIVVRTPEVRGAV